MMRWPWRRRGERRRTTTEAEFRREFNRQLLEAWAEVEAIDGATDVHITGNGPVARFDVTGIGDTSAVVLEVPVSYPGRREER